MKTVTLAQIRMMPDILRRWIEKYGEEHVYPVSCWNMLSIVERTIEQADLLDRFVERLQDINPTDPLIAEYRKMRQS